MRKDLNCWQHRKSGVLAGTLGSLWRESKGSISLWIVWICVALFLATGLLDLFHVASRQSTILLLGLSWPGVSERFWFHEFLTAPLLHGGVVHLLFNMLSLWMLGPSVEKAMGRGRYLLLTAVCAVCSEAGFLLMDAGAGHVMVGYSGVIFGILVAQAVYFPNSRVAILAIFPLKMKHTVLVLGAIELYLTLLPEQTGVANSAHLVGAVAGYSLLRGQRAMRFILHRRGRLSATTMPFQKRVQVKNQSSIPREL